MSLIESGKIEQEIAYRNITKSLIQFKEANNKILTLISSESVPLQNNIEIILKEIFKLQSKFLSLKSCDKSNTE